MIESGRGQHPGGDPPTSDVRRNALLLKISAIPLVQEAALRIDPVIAAADLLRLHDPVLGLPRDRCGEDRTFGAEQPIAVAAAAAAERRPWRLVYGNLQERPVVGAIPRPYLRDLGRRASDAGAGASARILAQFRLEGARPQRQLAHGHRRQHGSHAGERDLPAELPERDAGRAGPLERRTRRGRGAARSTPSSRSSAPSARPLARWAPSPTSSRRFSTGGARR